MKRFILSSISVFAMISQGESAQSLASNSEQPELILTGVVEMNSRKIAYFCEEGRPAPFYHSARIGEKKSDLDVLRIDVKAGTALVRHRGMVRELVVGAGFRVPRQLELTEDELSERPYPRPPREPIPGGV